jgi:hypothetical protein
MRPWMATVQCILLRVVNTKVSSKTTSVKDLGCRSTPMEPSLKVFGTRTNVTVLAFTATFTVRQGKRNGLKG